MGILASAYGPLLEHLSHSFEVSLSVAGGVLSAHYFGAVLGVLVGMRALKKMPSRTFVLAALTCLGLGCAGVAVGPRWAVFLGGEVAVGGGRGAVAMRWPPSV